MIGIDTYPHLENPKLKKARKLEARTKKMVLVSYRDSIIYRLYDREVDEIILSYSVDFSKELLILKKI